MDFLKNAYEMLPRKLRARVAGVSGAPSEQAVLGLSTTKTAVSLLCAACSLQTGSGVSELPYYGLSPPVYPPRETFFFLTLISSCPLNRTSTNTAPKHSAKAPPMSAGPTPSATHGVWSSR